MNKYHVEVVDHGQSQRFSVDLTAEELDALQMKAREVNRLAGFSVRIRPDAKA
ncbi:hypothetical protein ACQZV8_11550 [Magnetococcales bacterium HHB-1]